MKSLFHLSSWVRKSAALSVAALCFASGAANAQENLIANPGFEEGLASWGVFIPGDTPKEACQWQISKEAPHGGSSCLQLLASKPERFAMSSKSIAVQPGQRYKVSAWVRVPAGFKIGKETPGVLVRADFPSKNNEFAKAQVVLTVGGKAAPAPEVPRIANRSLPTEWTQISGVFQVPDGVAQMNVELFMWSGEGQSFWDDVELVKVDKSTPLTPMVKESNTVEGDELIPEKPEWAANHPRIVLDKATLEHVKAAVKQPNTPPALAWKRIDKWSKDLVSGADKSFDTNHPFASLDTLTVGTHKEQGMLEGQIRKWTTACDVLAFHYIVAGDARSGRAAANIALAIARKLPPDNVVLNKGFFYTRTFMVRSMVFVYDWCYPVLTPEERQDLRIALGSHARRMYSDSINNVWGQSTLGRIWNWNPGIASAWGLAMLAIMDETNLPDQQWLFQAARNVEDFFRFGVDQKGGAVEGPVYLSYGGGSSAYFMEALRQWSGEDLLQDTHLKLFPKFLPYEILPGGKRVNNLLDSDYRMAAVDFVLYPLARLQDASYAQWDWQELWGGWEDGKPTWSSVDDLAVAIWWRAKPEVKEPNLPLAAHAPFRGNVVARSGWDKDSVYFSIHAQIYTAQKHDQADKGQFTLYGYGEDFAIDSGYANDGQLNPEKSYSTGAHNLILINGKGQAAGKYHAQTSGFIRGFSHSDAVDWAWVDEKPAYEYYLNGPRKGGADGYAYTKTWQNKVVQADRQALFIRGKLPYVILFDNIQQDDQAQDYSWLLHTTAGKTFDVKGSTVTIKAETMAKDAKVLVQPIGAAAAIGTPIDPGSKQSGAWVKEINIPADGDYEVWALAGTDAQDPGTANSFFFSIDNGKAGFAKGKLSNCFVWETPAVKGLSWVSLNDDNGTTIVPALSLKAGKHMLQLRGREEGAWMATLCLVPAGQKMESSAIPKGSIIVKAAEGQANPPMKVMDIPPTTVKGILQMTVLSPSQFKTEQTTFATTTEGSHPRLALTTHAVAPNYLMVLVPRPLGTEGAESKPVVKPVEVRRGVAGVVAVDGQGEDFVARWDGKGIETKDLATDMQLFWMRGTPKQACAAVRGMQLVWKGKPLFQANSEASIVFDGKVLDVSGKNVSELRHGFGEKVVLRVNGNEVKAEAKDGLSVWHRQ